MLSAVTISWVSVDLLAQNHMLRANKNIEALSGPYNMRVCSILFVMLVNDTGL